MTGVIKNFGGIRVTIALLLLILMALSQGISYWSAHELLEATVHEREIDKIRTIGNVVEHLITHEGERVAQIARLLATEDGLAAGLHDLDAARPDEIANRLSNAYRVSGLDILEVTDSKEIIVYRAHSPGRRGDHAKAWGIFEALAGNSQLASSVDFRGIAIRAIEPLRADGKIIGTLTAGVRLNEEFAKSLNREVRAEVALLTRTGRVTNASRALADNLDPTAITAAFEQKIPIYREQPATHHTIVYLPLLVVDQAYVAVVQLDSSSAYQLLEQGGRRSALYAALVLAATLLVGFATLHYLLKPLNRLRDNAEKIAVEITGGEIRTDNRDEVAAVVQVLETLTNRLVEDNRELVLSEKRMAEAKWAAETADRAKTEFLATMSHEIRTPLNGVLGMAELLMLTGLNDKQQNMIKTIRECGAVLLGVINDILDFSQIEADRLKLEYTEFELTDLIEFCTESVNFRAREKGIKLETFIDLGILGIYRGDYRRLSQILLNLLANAIKFTGRGTVVVEVVSTDDHSLEFSVTDTGIGIDQAERHKLFERFSQIDSSNTRRFGGTGLGLAISRRLTELMGGTIGMDSEPGKGSRFHIRLPLPWISAGSYAMPASLTTAGLHGLLVDSDPQLREVTARQLRAVGLSLETVAGEEEAIVALRASLMAGRPFDLAMVADDPYNEFDDDVPVLLQAEPGFADLPVILLSADGAKPPTAASGRIEWLTRPLRHNALIETLERIISVRKNRSAETPSFPLRPVDTASLPLPVLRVLVAEDNPINREVVETMLSKLKQLCDTVENGWQALEALSRRHYDMIILDIKMPEMDGYEVTRRIRAMPDPIGNIPIIALTANAFTSDREQSFAAGMNDHLAKPINLATLSTLLKKYGPHATATGH
ncbi:MAG: ATP-binding protein [Rhodospirillaceae bacterium]